MAQNIYDDPVFFEAYSKLRRSDLDGASEWPGLQSLLPPMQGLRVVDLGCGFGWFCRWARKAGAESVVGLDLSERMLNKARANTRDDGVRYVRGDLDALELPVGAFDLAFSSLSFHYVEDFGQLIAAVHRALAPTGKLVFSINHPIHQAPGKLGLVTLADGRMVWPLDSYLREGPRSMNWGVGDVILHHRTLGTTLNTLIEQGFTVRHVKELPMFLLVAADRRSA